MTRIWHAGSAGFFIQSVCDSIWAGISETIGHALSLVAVGGNSPRFGKAGIHVVRAYFRLFHIRDYFLSGPQKVFLRYCELFSEQPTKNLSQVLFGHIAEYQFVIVGFGGVHFECAVCRRFLRGRFPDLHNFVSLFV